MNIKYNPASTSIIPEILLIITLYLTNGFNVKCEVYAIASRGSPKPSENKNEFPFDFHHVSTYVTTYNV